MLDIVKAVVSFRFPCGYRRLHMSRRTRRTGTLLHLRHAAGSQPLLDQLIGASRRCRNETAQQRESRALPALQQPSDEAMRDRTQWGSQV